MRSRLRLRHIARINPPTRDFDRLPANAEITFLPLEAIWPNNLNTTRVRRKSEVDVGYTKFQAGDILVPKITPTFEADRSVIACGLIGNVGAGTTELHVVRPTTACSSRYIRYLLSTREFLLGGEAEMIGVAGQKRVPESWLRNLPVPIANPDAQRNIADFLDVETSRIDAVIAKKTRLSGLFAERTANLVERQVRDFAAKHGERRLKVTVEDITVGIVITPSEWYVISDGVPALRGMNVKPGRIDSANLVELSTEGHLLHEKSALRAGDVVVVRTGQAGTAAVVPQHLHGANCIDLLIIRPGSLNSHYLSYVLNSDWTRMHIEKHSVGAIQAHFNVGALAELPIPTPPISDQTAFVTNMDRIASRHREIQDKLDSQIALLKEHRQALISAATAGELEVPGMAE